MENIIKPDENKQEIKKDQQYGNEFIAGSEDYGIIPLQKYFGNDLSDEDNEAIEYIYKTLGGNISNTSELLSFIKQTEMKLGVPAFGQSKAVFLKQYIKVNQELNQLQKIKEGYERQF
jgi:hypothetical protein